MLNQNQQSKFAWPSSIFYVESHQDRQVHQVAFWQVETDGNLTPWVLAPNRLFALERTFATPQGAEAMQAETERIAQFDDDDFFDKPLLTFAFNDDDVVLQ